MKLNDWCTKKVFGRNGSLIRMEHSYNFRLQFNCNNGKKTKYVYVNDKSPRQVIAKKEKSMYKSELDFPYPWNQGKIGANLGDDSEEEKVKKEWFQYVRSKRLGNNWKEFKERKKKVMKEENRISASRNLVVHHVDLYEEWLKRKTAVRKFFITLNYFSKEKWNSNKNSHVAIDFTPNSFKTTSSYLDDLPVYAEVFSNVPDAFPDRNFIFPNDVHSKDVPTSVHSDKTRKEKSKNVKNSVLVPDNNCDLEDDSKDFIESPTENFAKVEPKPEIDCEMDSTGCLIERRTIFKNPTVGKIKCFHTDTQAVLTARWENKNVDVLFFSWAFITQKGEKLTPSDSLKSYLKLGQEVHFHGARSILGTDMYETPLVYEANAYPTLASRSGYDLKKWTIDKELYTFPRSAVIKLLILPYHAVVEIEAPARNLPRKCTYISMENCYVNRNDEFHAEGWIDEFVKKDDVIYVALTHKKSDGSVSVKEAWKFPKEQIVNPKLIKSPNFKVPRDKFVFSCKEGKKSCVGTIRDIYPNRGVFLASIKSKTYEIHFDQVYVDGYEARVKELKVGSEINFRNFRKPPYSEVFWSPLVWQGPQPNMADLMKRYETENSRDAVIEEYNTIYVGKIERFILPSHAVIKTKSNNDLDLFVSISKTEVLPEAPDHLWIDKIITMNDVLTFKMKKISDQRYAAIQVYN